MESKFNFFIPIDEEIIEKAARLPVEERYKNMILQGVASDNTEDIDGEVLEPSGYVLDTFLKSGYINYEHLAKKSPKFLIGEPISAKVSNDKFFIKAKLWENSDVAKETWDKIIEMKQSGSNRRPGWSIEGKSLLKDPFNPKRIKKALITNVALTFSPVNGNTWADIVKGTQKSDYVELEYDKVDDVDVKEYLFEFSKDGKKYRVAKNFSVYEVVEKSMDTTSTAPLVPESLDGKVKNLQFDNISKAVTTVSQYIDLDRLDESFRNKIIKNIRNNFFI